MSSFISPTSPNDDELISDFQSYIRETSRGRTERRRRRRRRSLSRTFFILMRYKVEGKKKNDGEKLFRVCLIRKWKCLHWHQQQNFSISNPPTLSNPRTQHSIDFLDLDCNILSANFSLNRCRQWCFVLFPILSVRLFGRVRRCNIFYISELNLRSKASSTLWIESKIHKTWFFFRCTMNRQSNDKYLCALDVSSGGKLFLLAFQLQALCALLPHI